MINVRNSIYKTEQEKIDAQLKQFKNKSVNGWVKDWVDEKLASRKDHKYIMARLYTLRTILSPLEKPITKVIEDKDKQTIIQLLKPKHIKRTHRIVLKAFFKWVNDGEHPECTKWISTKNWALLNAKDFLTRMFRNGFDLVTPLKSEN